MADATSSNSLLSLDRVPVPLGVRMRRLRNRAVPILCLVGTTAAWLALWNVQARSVSAIGRVSTLRIDITSPASGLIVRMPHNTGLQWSLFDHVREGDVIAEYDDSEYRSDVAQFEHDAAMLRKELTDWRKSFEDGGAQPVSALLARLEKQEVDIIAALLAQVAQGATAQRITEGQSSDSVDLPGDIPDDARASFIELHNERQLLAIRALQLRNQANALVIRAPITGTLVDVFCSPGQRLHAGAPIATLAADYGSYVVSYLPEAVRFEPLPGMRVTLRTRDVGASAVDTQIEEVGRQIEPIPLSLATNPTIPERGLPVRIALPADIDMQPGVIVDIIYHANETM